MGQTMFTHFFIHMDTKAILDHIKKRIYPILDESDVEIVEFILKRVSRSLMLRLLVDKKGGITLDECARLNKHIVALIDKDSLISGPYTLEVSSPGLDRPLKNRRDFEKSIGKEVEIWLSEPIEGQPYIDGSIEDADDNKVHIIDVKGKKLVVVYDKINKAKLKI